MPGIVGAIKIVSVGPGSVVHIGDSVQITPKSISKTFAGAGSFNTGDGLSIRNGYNLTNTNDSDLVDNSATLVN